MMRLVRFKLTLPCRLRTSKTLFSMRTRMMTAISEDVVSIAMVMKYPRLWKRGWSA